MKYSVEEINLKIRKLKIKEINKHFEKMQGNHSGLSDIANALDMIQCRSNYYLKYRSEIFEFVDLLHNVFFSYDKIRKRYGKKVYEDKEWCPFLFAKVCKANDNVVKILMLLKKFENNTNYEKILLAANDIITFLFGINLATYFVTVLQNSKYGPDFVESCFGNKSFFQIPNFQITKYGKKLFDIVLNTNTHITEETKKKWKELQNIYDILQ